MELTEALRQAEALARTIRTASDGRIDLTPLLRNSVSPAMPPLPVSWGEAQTEAKILKGTVDRTRSGR